MTDCQGSSMQTTSNQGRVGDGMAKLDRSIGLALIGSRQDKGNLGRPSGILHVPG